ncbi:C39 family peptidase [Methylocystis sp.]|uniref:C39 family peptidase n=1 Tax=Methylocystis sp. TaxID=1911079 RepID=UPI003D0D684F
MIDAERAADGRILSIPYCQQRKNDYCGAAALEMVFRYYRPSKLTKFNQDRIFRTLAKREPMGSGSYRINGDDLIETARKRGFCAGWGRVHPNLRALRAQTVEIVVNRGIPLIACQRFTNARPELGHFRVIVGVAADYVVVHDPHPEFGGAAQKWSWEKISDYWRYTGLNVTGGVAIWVAPEPLPDNLLCPGAPNPWPELSGTPHLHFSRNPTT